MAGNSHKGELGFTAEGRQLTLSYSIDALCRIEDRFDKSALTVLAAMMRDPQVRKLRAVLWAGLQEHHKDIDEKTAGELIRSLGGVQPTVELINKAFLAAFPPAEAAEGSADPQAPPETADGIGAVSTASGLN
jgi:hypothetical protein